MKIFVTGGSGFIGKNLIDRLIEEDHTVFCLIQKQKESTNFSNEKVIFIEGDLKNPSSYAEIFDQNIDIVYHLAAIPGQKWGFKKEDYQKINVLGTSDLLASCHQKIKRFIFCSSISAISKNNFLRDPYGKSKSEAEKIVEEYQKKGLETIIIRPAIVYGPGDTKGMIKNLCSLIIKNKFFLVGKGENIVPLIYVDDLVNSFILAKNSRINGEKYEIIGPDFISFKEISSKISLKLSKKTSCFHIPVGIARMAAFLSEIIFPIFGKEPLVTQHRVDISIRNNPLSSQKAKNKLGFSAHINFEEGIKRTITWYKKNGYI